MFLLSVFAKKDQANVSKAERMALAAVAKVLIEKYGAKRRTHHPGANVEANWRTLTCHLAHARLRP